VRCPRCGELSPEGAAICDNCDEILDASFLEGADEVSQVAGEKTDVGPAPTAPSKMPERLRKTQRGGWNPRGPAASPEAAARRPYLAEPAAAPVSPLDEARKAAEDLASFFRSLTPGDRWATGASALLLASLALPWRWTREDDEIIGLVAAWPVALLAGATLLFVYLRARKAGAALDRRLRLAQLGASALAAIFTGLFLSWASQSQAFRGAGKTVAVALSTPMIGAYLGLVCAVAALFAAVPALKE
jgi:hypothetical protein